ncbi:MAG: hypothetical protein ACI4ES_14070 [Roseburia sp.]
MKTFDLCDLNDEFWEKVIYFKISHNIADTSLGRLEMVTEDKKYYFLKLEALPFSEYRLGEHFDFFRRIDKFENNHKVYAIENEGWTFLTEDRVMVRNDYLPAYQSANKELNEERDEERGYRMIETSFPPLDRIAKALGVRFDELESINYIHNKKEPFSKGTPTREEIEKNYLTEEEMGWKHFNRQGEHGQLYAAVAIVLKEEDGRVMGSKYTIFCQNWRVGGDGCITPIDDAIFNLYCKDYSDVVGPPCFPKSSKIKGKYNDTYYKWITFDEFELHDFGKLLFSFTSFEEAKEYALWYANCNGRIGRDKKITDWDNVNRDYTRRIQRCEAYKAYREHIDEIMEVVCNYDSSLDRPSHCSGFLMEAILETVPDITKEQLLTIWPDIPKVLEQGTQKCIEKEIERCYRYRARYGKEDKK